MKPLTILIIVLIGISCCKKDSEPTLFPLLQETKDWMFFDTGTYWVYKEMNSAVEDSQYVVSSQFLRLGPNSDPSRPQLIDEAAVLEINRGFRIYLDGTGGGNIIRKDKRIGTEKVEVTLYHPPNTVGSHSPASSAVVLEFIPNFNFKGIEGDLIKRFDTSDKTENRDSVEYHIMKGVGIIRKINHTKNEDWQLQRFNIKMNIK